MCTMVFVGGFPSGGTDLLLTMLNTHPDICLCSEMPWLKDIVNHGYSHTTYFTDISEIHKLQGLVKKKDIWNCMYDPDYDFTPDLEEKPRLSLAEVLHNLFLPPHKKDYEVWGNKTPQNTEHIDSLTDLIPSAKFLIITRDVRDVCLSWKKKWGKDMLWCSSKWADRMIKGQQMTSRLPDHQSLYITYEALITQTEQVCKDMCRFLEIPFSDRMLKHHEYTSDRVPGKINYGEPIKPTNFEKWRTQLSVKQVERIEEIAFMGMNNLGYPVQYAKHHRDISKVEFLRGWFRDAWGWVFIGNRYSKNNTFFKRLRVLWRSLYIRLFK